MKSLLIIFLFLPIISFGQIYNVFQIKNQDTLEFKGNVIKLPPVQNTIHCDYLVELDGHWLIKSMSIDKVTPGIELFGYASNEDGQFHLIAKTNSSDQVFQVGACIQYLLIRLGPGVWESVNIDFSME